MITVSVLKFRRQFADLVNKAAFNGERIVITRHGKPVAALVHPEDAAFLESREDAHDIAAVKRAMKEKGRNIPLSEFKASESL